MQIGERLEMIRKANNKSQSEIAEILNTTQQQYWKYEKNKQELPIRHLITLANYYNTTADNILGITNVMQAIQVIIDGGARSTPPSHSLSFYSSSCRFRRPPPRAYAQY